MRKNTTKKQETLIFPTCEEDLIKFHDLPLKSRMQIVELGVTKANLEALKRLLSLDYDQLSELMMMTNRAIHHKKGGDKFSEIVSDRIIMIVELYSFGCETFGNLEQFQQWMKSPSERMANVSPQRMIKTHSGLLAVREILTDIRNGQL